MRKLIAGMKIAADGKFEGPDGIADWVEAWSDDYGMMARVDACLLGGGMYGGYEQYWTAVRSEPLTPTPATGNPPTPAERAYADFAGRTPHYVLSTKIETVAWPNTRLLRRIDDVAAMKEKAGKDIYLVGGGGLVRSLIDAGLVDELRLIIYPLIAGAGRELFAGMQRRHRLELRTAETMSSGRVSLTYGLG